MSNLQDITGTFSRPIFILEKDNAKRNQLPERFRGKQFTNYTPKNGKLPQDVLFDKNFKGLYEKRKYMDQVAYTKTAKDKQLGFGTSDATKRDEFCFHTRCEQYREQMHNEVKFNEAASSQFYEKWLNAPDDPYDIELRKNQLDIAKQFEGPNHLFDVGRSSNTIYCKKCPRERFYCPHKVGEVLDDAYTTGKQKRTCTSAQQIGKGATVSNTYESSVFARRPLIKNNFYRKAGVLKYSAH